MSDTNSSIAAASCEHPTPASAEHSSSSEYANRRRAPRVETQMSVRIFPDPNTELSVVSAVSTVVSPRGASFSLKAPPAVLSRFHIGQHVTVETSFGDRAAEVNAMWLDPKIPLAGDVQCPFLSLKLIDQTWL